MNNFPIQRYLSSSSSCHDGFQKGTTTTTAASVERLKSQLRSREGEVFVLQVSDGNCDAIIKWYTFGMFEIQYIKCHERRKQNLPFSAFFLNSL